MSLHHHESPLTALYKTRNFQYKGISSKCIQMGVLTQLATGEKFEFFYHAHLLISSTLGALKHSFENQVCLVGYQELVDDYLATLFDANQADYNNK